MAGRNPKPVILLEGHYTNKEKSERKTAEENLLTGVPMKIKPEVKADPAAKKEFERIKRLFAKIGKDDALYENAINRYALLQSESAELKKKQVVFLAAMKSLEEKRESGESDLSDEAYYGLLAKLNESVVKLDKQLQSKRGEMLAIEKENSLTVAAALRTIPHKQEKKEASGIAAYRQRRNEA